MSESKQLFSLWQAFRLRQLSTVIEQIDSIRRSPSPLFPELQSQIEFIELRTLAERGYFGTVFDRCQSASEQQQSSWDWQIKLWCAFFQTYRTSQVNHALTTLSIATEQLMCREDPELMALAKDLHARTIMMGYVMRRYRDAHLPQVYTLLEQSIQLYRDANNRDEQYSTMLRLGDYLLKSNTPSEAEAEAIYQQVFKSEDALWRAQAALRLGELTFRRSIHQQQDKSQFQVDLRYYKEALQLFNQSGHTLGPADVLLNVGQQFVKVGIDATQDLLDALKIYEAQDHLSGQQNTLNTLSQWYTRQGDIPQAIAYHMQCIDVAKRSQYSLGHANALMGLGDAYMRAGSYGRAVAAYQQAHETVDVPWLHAMLELNIANSQQLAKQLDDAAQSATRAKEKLQALDAHRDQSTALYILGNILSGQKKWEEALKTLREGEALDAELNMPRERAEKLQLIAMILVVKHRPTDRDPALPQAIYDEAIRIYESSLALLQSLTDPAAAAIKANIYQLMGQSSILAEQLDHAEHYLQVAREVYVQLEMQMQVATTDALLGLLYYDIGRKGQTEYYVRAQSHYRQAYQYYRSADMRDMAASSAYYQALALVESGIFSTDTTEQTHLWFQAQEMLEAAEADMTFVRGSVVHVNVIQQESSRLNLIVDRVKVYDLAMRLSRLRGNRLDQWRWMQRHKGRVLLESLAFQSIPAPTSLPDELCQREHTFLSQLSRSSQTEYMAIMDKLRAIWDDMEAYPDTASYLALRRGEPMQWAELKDVLDG